MSKEEQQKIAFEMMRILMDKASDHKDWLPIAQWMVEGFKTLNKMVP